MSDGIRWIGENAYKDANGGVPGMRGSISLTAARGVETEDFLVRLGADLEQLDCQDLYKDRNDLALPSGGYKTHINWAMYGTCGDWLYVLEDWGMATFYAGYRSVAAMEPRTGEEIVCLTMNSWDPPQLILHAPGDHNRTWQAEFGEPAGWSPTLDAALRAAGAVFPSAYYDSDTTEEEERQYFEEHHKQLPLAVFTGVGRYCGLTIDRAAVEAGLLPLAILPMPES
ncbi:hypothetical protein [Streptomyces sp. NBC_01750]|uniref:hypothetical protein n=1 Tax=Streptomyces sp. NBC_01750 TaxID=2975928 RepID=UPI002DDA76FC|nr:hypothetical protein [Streptomyces sp. NBC_01750]WSD37387.1 hypothetical protein OG966_39100 [Streptomyces sp. NBC_01750]